MLPTIKISSVWEDEDLFEISIYASNSKFCGEARCYTTREEIRKLSEVIECFPRSPTSDIHFSTYSSDNFSYFSLHFLCIDGSGHIIVRVKVADILVSYNAYPVKNFAEFDIAVEPASIDIFSRGLSILSSAVIGDVTAVLDGKT